MSDPIPGALLGRLSYLLGTLYRRSLDQENAALDRTTVDAITDALHDLGMLTRTRDLLVLTESGEDAQQRGRRLVRDAEAACLAALDDAERLALTAVLTKAVTGHG